VIDSAAAVEFFTRRECFSWEEVQSISAFSSRRIEEVEGKRQIASKKRETMATSPPFFSSNEGSLSEKKAAFGS
jgi:hypothetical protein